MRRWRGPWVPSSRGTAADFHPPASANLGPEQGPDSERGTGHWFSMPSRAMSRFGPRLAWLSDLASRSRWATTASEPLRRFGGQSRRRPSTRGAARAPRPRVWLGPWRRHARAAIGPRPTRRRARQVVVRPRQSSSTTAKASATSARRRRPRWLNSRRRRSSTLCRRRTGRRIGVARAALLVEVGTERGQPRAEDPFDVAHAVGGGHCSTRAAKLSAATPDQPSNLHPTSLTGSSQPGPGHPRPPTSLMAIDRHFRWRLTKLADEQGDRAEAAIDAPVVDHLVGECGRERHVVRGWRRPCVEAWITARRAIRLPIERLGRVRWPRPAG